MAKPCPPISKDLVEWLEERYPLPSYSLDQLPVDIQRRAFHDGRQDILKFIRAESLRQENPRTQRI